MTRATNQREKVMSENCDVIFFPINGQFEAIQKLDSIRIVNQTDVSLIAACYLTKTKNRTKISVTAVTLFL